MGAVDVEGDVEGPGGELPAFGATGGVRSETGISTWAWWPFKYRGLVV